MAKPLSAKLADDVCGTLGAAGEVGFDPIMIITIITSIIGIFKDCNFSAKRARTELQNPSMVGRVVVKRQVAKAVPRRMKQEERELVEAALLDVGKTLTEKQVATLYAEAA